MKPWHTNSPWTEDLVETLKKLWADGLSASCIAAELPGMFSRSAVIGKVHRLGLSHRKTVRIREGGVTLQAFGPRPQRRRRKNYSPLTQYCGDPAMIEQSESEAAIRSEFYATEVVDLTEEQRAQAVTFAALDENGKQHCKWPIGDPRKSDFVFCGCERVYGPYCAAHTRIAAPRAANA